MPRGRPRNHDRRINDLLKQLRAALVAREAARIEATVSEQMDSLLSGLRRGGERDGAAQPAHASPAPAASTKGRGNRKPRSAAFREAARKRMIAYWAARRKGQGKGGRRRTATAAAT